MTKYSDAERLQKHLFDSIALEYEKQYGEYWSRIYHRQFINVPMLKNVSLSGIKVLDAMCGTGESSEYLVENGAEVTGIDISQEAINRFKERWPNCNTKCTSILDTGLESNYYDCVVVDGALHHIYPDLSKAINEIHRVLKPGGYFCFNEPYKGSLPDLVRQFWYKYDNLFAKNESAINLKSLKREFSSKFEFITEGYKGNLAYLLVFNSWIFRIPLPWKPIYSPVFIMIESIIEKLKSKILSCYVVCQWKKKIREIDIQETIEMNNTNSLNREYKNLQLS